MQAGMLSKRKLKKKSRMQHSNTSGISKVNTPKSGSSNIIHWKTQSYLTSSIFYDEEVELLHALRSRYTNVKANFSSKFKNDMRCPLCLTDREDQQYILSCSLIKRKLESQATVQYKNLYEDIFADQRKQKEISYLFSRLLKIRNSLLDENFCIYADPSTSAEVLES